MNMNTHTIKLTRDWTNPETKTEHGAGSIVTVPEYMLRLESSMGLQGGYSLDLSDRSESTPPAPAKAAPAQPPKRNTTDTTTNNDKE